MCLTVTLEDLRKIVREELRENMHGTRADIRLLYEFVDDIKVRLAATESKLSTLAPAVQPDAKESRPKG